MTQRVKAHSDRLELDTAFQYAVTLAWEDLTKPSEVHSVRVEYLCEPGTALDHSSVWSVGAGGYQDLVCDYWTSASLDHLAGAFFGTKSYSDKLAKSLDFIMNNQGLFTRPADAGRHGLVLIQVPGAEDHAEAANWMRAAQALQYQTAAAEASRPPSYPPPHAEAWSRMDGEGHRNEQPATQPDATGYSV